ncbi:hypothetical protein BH10PSE19_BH10PSE19_01180 [soil metagenome]
MQNPLDFLKQVDELIFEYDLKQIIAELSIIK